MSLHDAFSKVSDQMGEDFKRRIFDLHGKPRPLINIYVNGKNTRFGGNGMTGSLADGDSIHILPAVAGGAELCREDMQRYSRQIMLEEIGFAGMAKTSQCTCLSHWGWWNWKSCSNPIDRNGHWQTEDSR